MPIWPFRRRRRANTVHETPREQPAPVSEKPKQPSLPAETTQQPNTTTSKSNSRPSTKRAASPPPADAHAPPIPRRSSKNGSQRKRRLSQPAQAIPDEKAAAENRQLTVTKDSKDKENVPPSRHHAHHASREDITALPRQGKLDQSPHLRAVDLDNRPQIPYNFRPHSMSQTSVNKQDTATSKPRRPNTLHSKRSTQDYSSPARRASSRNSKKRDEALREEEIRAMSKPIPIPKRQGDGPMRRDSKKFRGLLSKDSEVSLPPEGSIHSGMSGVLEQRGWEIGSLAVFNPRPAVRLSGTPQYVPSQSVPQASGMIYRIDSTKDKEKKPVLSDAARKRRTVGDEVDDLDASDIRAIMERDAKRREQRHRERQEKLERKLRSREGRNRGDSDARRQRDADEQRRIEEGRARAQQQLQSQGPLTPPSAIHPALRNQQAQAAPVGLGIGEARAASPDPMDIEPTQPATSPSHEFPMQVGGLETHQEEETTDPFSDAHEHLPASPWHERPPTMSHTSLPAESPMEEPEVRTAQAVRMSMANTPPLSPIHAQNSSQIAEALRQQSISAASASNLPPPPPIPVERRSSDPPKERRSGAWASFFRRGGTTKSRKEGVVSPAETGFSNTSRESMRNQPLPAHLVGTDRPPAVRRISGPPVRTQSKFREDLPEMPISPPESRQQSPDVMTSAAAVAAARRAGRSTPQPIDIPGRVRDADRNDTPVSRGHTAMAGSLASIDSEGSWLASGEKRHSKQSALGRSYSKRNADFSASYEELGGDRDAEYFSRNRESRSRKASNPTMMGSDPAEASEEEETLDPINTADEPLAVHGSVRRKPTLVQRDPRLKSREGLVQEFAAGESGEVIETPFETPPEASPDEEYEPESPIDKEPVQLARARSVQQYGSRHSRQFSAGSAKLLDVQGKRTSESRNPTPEPSSAAPTPTLK